MRHYSAKQRADGRWDYTCGSRPIGYCGGYHQYGDEMLNAFTQEQIDKLNADIEAHKNLYHTHGHSTKKEACECYKQYQLDFHLKLTPKVDNPRELYKCDICGEFCSGTAWIGAYNYFKLCEKHCNRSDVSKLYSVWESWES